MNRVPRMNAWFFIAVKQHRILNEFQESHLHFPVTIHPWTQNRYDIVRLNKQLRDPHAELLRCIVEELRDFPDSAC